MYLPEVGEAELFRLRAEEGSPHRQAEAEVGLLHMAVGAVVHPGHVDPADLLEPAGLLAGMEELPRPFLDPVQE